MVESGLVLLYLFLNLALLLWRQRVSLDVKSAYLLLNTVVELVDELAAANLCLALLLHNELLLADLFLFS